ncbi:MAG: GAF domain-containing protein [Candidatus Aminicenantes bacterium]|nr:GAF domain-containing protein [Candidatus Aminicenantes bacterium]
MKEKKLSTALFVDGLSEAELKEIAVRIKLISEIGHKTTAILDLDELLPQALGLISRTFSYYNMSIFLREGEYIILKTATRPEHAKLVDKLRFKVGKEGITGWVAEKGKAVIVEDVREDKRYKAGFSYAKTRSEISVPIRYEKSIIGVLDAQSRSCGAFSQNDLFTLKTLADQLAVAIENAKLFSQVIHEGGRRRKADAALKKSESRYKSLVDHLPVGVYRSTPDGRIIEANQTLAHILGYKRVDDLMEVNVRDLYVRKEERNKNLQQLDKSITGFHEPQLRRKDKKKIWVRDYSRAVCDLKGNTVFYDGILVDITERRLAQARLQTVLKELERSNAELQQFAYVASHDLQEPLRMVASYVRLLSRRYKGKLDKDAEEFIWFAEEGATRMKQMISDLLDYSRVGTRGKVFKLLKAKDLLPQVLDNLKVSLEESEAEVKAGPMPEFYGDETQIIRLFQNLIVNAVKFRSSRPLKINIKAERLTNEWKFSVEDNGIGISPEYFDRIFLIFQRLHTRKDYPGTGIGLAICKRIVERHEGKIWVESQPGKGSRFMFTIKDLGPNGKMIDEDERNLFLEENSIGKV